MSSLARGKVAAISDFLGDKLDPRGVEHHFSVKTVEEDYFEEVLPLAPPALEVSADWCDGYNGIVR